MTRLVPEGLSGCPSGSSFPAPVFSALLVPCVHSGGAGPGRGVTVLRDAP